MDQQNETMKLVANAVSIYAKELRKKGFNREETLELVSDYQCRLFDQLKLGIIE